MRKEKHPVENMKKDDKEPQIINADIVQESANDEELQLANEVEELRKQSEENFNKFARMSADFDNFRKRVAKEREEIFQVALEGIVKDLIPVVDNLERAYGSFAAEGLEQKYLDGVDMVMKQLASALTKNGLSEVDTSMKFDPNFHHAIMQEPGEEDDKITLIMQKGYMLGNKVLRPAMVKVSVKETI